MQNSVHEKLTNQSSNDKINLCIVQCDSSLLASNNHQSRLRKHDQLQALHSRLSGVFNNGIVYGLGFRKRKDSGESDLSSPSLSVSVSNPKSLIRSKTVRQFNYHQQKQHLLSSKDKPRSSSIGYIFDADLPCSGLFGSTAVSSYCSHMLHTKAALFSYVTHKHS